MKYNEKHIPEYVGASGKCEICGVIITLEKKDKPERHLLDFWIVKCPVCGNSVRCKK